MSTKRSGKDAEKDEELDSEEESSETSSKDGDSDDEDSDDEDSDDEDSDDEDSDDEDSDDEDSDDEDSDDKDSDDEDSDDEDSDDEDSDEKAGATRGDAGESARGDDKDAWDDDDWDDDDDDLGDGGRPARRKAKPVDDVPDKPKRKRRPAQPATAGAVTEEEINSPTMQTLGMLSILAAATLVMWGVGRASCNFREVGEGMKPREVALEDRTNDPKAAGFEFHHALGINDFDSAVKLAKGAAKRAAEQKRQTCMKRADACKKEKETLSAKVLTVAELVKRAGMGAIVRAWSVESAEPNKKYLMTVTREGKDWKVTSYKPDDGRLPELPGADQLIPGHRGAAPGGSANPMGVPPGLRQHLRKPDDARGTASEPVRGKVPSSRRTLKPAPQPVQPAPKPAAPAPRPAPPAAKPTPPATPPAQ